MRCLPGWLGREGVEVPSPRKCPELVASRYRVDVEWSLGGRRELHDASRGERWAAVGSPLLPSLALSGNKGEESLRGNRVLKASYRYNVEP